jgi:hypothetical protein
MTKGDREALAKLVRERAKLGRQMAEQRGAELIADGEAKLARIYSFDNSVWRDITAAAQTAVRQADAKIAARCRELGIPEEFRPGVNLGRYCARCW